MKIFIVMALFFTFSPLSFAKKRVETPVSLDGVVVVDAKAAKSAIDAGAQAVDVRKRLEYVDEHILGAVNVSYKEKSSKKADFDMGKDKWKFQKLDMKKSYVFYCNGNTCWKSYKASRMAKKEGFGNIYWLRGGIPAWKKAGFKTVK